MHRKTSKRRQILMRTFVYALMTVSVVTIVTILMFIILGYSFNRQDGRLEQGGLLQFASIPSGATVTLDNVQVGSRTPSKANVDARDHHVRMDIKGYRAWQKSITVQAGGIGWLSYARLVPNDIKVERLRNMPELSASLASTDRKWIVAQENASSSTFTLINIEPDTPKFSSLAIADSLLTPAITPDPQTFTLQSWSKNSDKLLVKRTYDATKTEWFVIDRQNPKDTINLTTSFGINASDIKFGERNGSNAYVLADDSVIRRIDFGNKTLSGPLAENISEFSVYENNTVVYVTKPDQVTGGKTHVGYREGGMDAPQTVFSYAAGVTDVHVAFGEYYGKKYVGVTHDKIQQVFVGTLPRGDEPARLKELGKIELSSAPLRITIGDNGRLAVAEMADGFATYDIELEKPDVTVFTKPATAPRPLQWLDGYLLVSDRGGIARLYEFDGANQQDIMPVYEGHAVSFSGNEKFLYGFSQNADGAPSFVRARLTVAE